MLQPVSIDISGDNVGATERAPSSQYLAAMLNRLSDADFVPVPAKSSARIPDKREPVTRPLAIESLNLARWGPVISTSPCIFLKASTSPTIVGELPTSPKCTFKSASKASIAGQKEAGDLISCVSAIRPMLG